MKFVKHDYNTKMKNVEEPFCLQIGIRQKKSWGKSKNSKKILAIKGGVMRAKLSTHKTILVISGKCEKYLKFIITFCSLYFQL